MTPAEIWLTVVSTVSLSVWAWLCVSITVKTLMYFNKKRKEKNGK